MTEPRAVKSIWFNGANGDLTIEASEETTLTWIQEYLGTATTSGCSKSSRAMRSRATTAASSRRFVGLPQTDRR